MITRGMQKFALVAFLSAVKFVVVRVALSCALSSTRQHLLLGEVRAAPPRTTLLRVAARLGGLD